MQGFFKALNISQAVIVGHSMGGAIALSLALRYPYVCNKLVLLGTAAKFTVPTDILEALNGRTGEAADAICRYAFPTGFSPSLIEATRQMIRELPPETLRADYQACEAFDVRSNLDEILQPALIVGAEQDLLTPPQDQYLLAEKIPGSRLTMLKEAGHTSFLSHADAIRDLMLEFVET